MHVWVLESLVSGFQSWFRPSISLEHVFFCLWFSLAHVCFSKMSYKNIFTPYIHSRSLLALSLPPFMPHLPKWFHDFISIGWVCLGLLFGNVCLTSGWNVIRPGVVYREHYCVYISLLEVLRNPPLSTKMVESIAVNKSLKLFILSQCLLLFGCFVKDLSPQDNV